MTVDAHDPLNPGRRPDDRPPGMDVTFATHYEVEQGNYIPLYFEYALEFPGRGMPTPPSESFVRNARRLYPGATLRRRLVGDWEPVEEES